MLNEKQLIFAYALEN